MIRASLACVALWLAATASAFAAGTVSRDFDSQITYTAAGAANVVLTDAPSGAGTALTLTETGIALAPMSDDCVDNGDSVTCTFLETGRVTTTLSNVSDVFDGGALTRSTMTVQETGGGDDVLTGGQLTVSANGFPTGDVLRAGDGADTVLGGAGNDQISDGGSGGDLADGGPGDDDFITLGTNPVADSLRGGEGHDSLWVRSVAMPSESFTVDLAAGTIVEASGAGVPSSISGFEDLRTDDGNDTLLGDAGPNVIRSGLGNDIVDGRSGADLLFAESGDDRLLARDGIADRVDGGPDADTCVLDQLDESAECETPDIATIQPFGSVIPDTTPMRCGVRRFSRIRSRSLRRRALSVRASCDEPGELTARVLGSILGVPVRGGRAARAGDIELARATATLGAPGDATLRLRVPRRLRAVLRRGAVLRVQLRALDAAGNRSPVVVRRIRLR